MSITEFDLSFDVVTSDITDEYVGYLLGATKYCLEKNSHTPGVVADIKGDLTGGIRFKWESVTDRERNTYGDPDTATEKGAEGIAFIIVDRFTDYKVGQQSFVGTGFDFYLVPKGSESTLMSLCEDYIKLEVSGIDKKSPTNRVETRIKKKSKQAATVKDGKEFYAIVPEFGDPMVEVKHGYSV